MLEAQIPTVAWVQDPALHPLLDLISSLFHLLPLPPALPSGDTTAPGILQPQALNLLFFLPRIFTRLNTASTSDLLSNVTFSERVSPDIYSKNSNLSSTSDAPILFPLAALLFFLTTTAFCIKYILLILWIVKLHKKKDFCLCCLQLNSQGLEECSINLCSINE